MEQQQPEIRDPAIGVPPVDRVISDAPSYAARARRRGAPAEVQIADYVLPERDRVRWGPIVAGSLISLGSMILLAMFGIAVGASAFEPGTDLTDWTTGAAIYGGITALVAMFVGGWVAGRSAAVDDDLAGPINGLLAGMTTIVVLVASAALGVDNVLGFLGGNLANISDFAGNVVQGEAADASVQNAFNDIEDGAWGTLIVLILGFGAAAVGGWLGQSAREADLSVVS